MLSISTLLMMIAAETFLSFTIGTEDVDSAAHPDWIHRIRATSVGESADAIRGCSAHTSIACTNVSGSARLASSSDTLTCLAQYQKFDVKTGQCSMFHHGSLAQHVRSFTMSLALCAVTS